MEKKNKLVLAVLQGSDSDNTIRNLNEHGFMVTVLSSTGGFLKKKSTTVMIHAQLLGRDQLPAVKRLGVIPSFFVAHVYHWGDIHWENLGPDRADGISPAGSAAELGIPCTFHTDAPVIPPDLLETVWCAVDRTTRSGRCLGPEERVDVQTALEAVTVNAAYQYFEERDKGTLAPGKQIGRASCRERV